MGVGMFMRGRLKVGGGTGKEGWVLAMEAFIVGVLWMGRPVEVGSGCLPMERSISVSFGIIFRMGWAEWNFLMVSFCLAKNILGDFYQGDFNNSDMHGRGQMSYKNGDIYTGEWVSDSKEGYGTTHYKDGSSYVGIWANDRRHGIGKFTTPTGKVREFMWVNDLETDTAVDYLDKFRDKEILRDGSAKQ